MGISSSNSSFRRYAVKNNGNGIILVLEMSIKIKPGPTGHPTGPIRTSHRNYTNLKRSVYISEQKQELGEFDLDTCKLFSLYLLNEFTDMLEIFTNIIHYLSFMHMNVKKQF